MDPACVRHKLGAPGAEIAALPGGESRRLKSIAGRWRLLCEPRRKDIVKSSPIRIVLAHLVASLVLLGLPTGAAAVPINEVVADLGESDGGPVEVRANGHLLVIAQSESGAGDGIYDVAPDGQMTRVAGCGCQDTGQGIGDGGPATDAVILSPGDVQVTPDGGFLVSDRFNHRVRKVDANGIITTVAGNGQADIFTHTPNGDGGPATDAKVGYPSFLSETSDGGFLVTQNNGIRKVDADGIISTIAGTTFAEDGYAGDNGPAAEARFYDLADVSATSDGGYLVADPGNCRIRKIDAEGIITTIAGNGSKVTVQSHTHCETLFGTQFVDGTPALETPIGLPRDVAALPDEGFLISTIGYLLRASQDGLLTKAAGIGYGGTGGDGCPATDVAVDSLSGVASAGETIYYVDYSGQVGDRAHWLLRSISEGTVTDCDLIGIQGTANSDAVEGGQYQEEVAAADGNDKLDGSGGADKLLGEGGGDRIDAGPGADKVSGGSGGDKIDVVGGGTDTVNCGSGRDVVEASRSDRVAPNCEVVR